MDEQSFRGDGLSSSVMTSDDRAQFKAELLKHVDKAAVHETLQKQDVLDYQSYKKITALVNSFSHIIVNQHFQETFPQRIALLKTEKLEEYNRTISELSKIQVTI